MNVPKIIYNAAAKYDLSQLGAEHQKQVRAWEESVELPHPTRVGYLRDQVGPVQIWFQVEGRQINVCDIRVLTK